MQNLDRAPITEIVLDFAIAATTLTLPIGPILGYVAADAALNYRRSLYARGISWIIGMVPATAIIYYSSQIYTWPAALINVSWQAISLILAAGLTGMLIVWRVGRRLDDRPAAEAQPLTAAVNLMPPKTVSPTVRKAKKTVKPKPTTARKSATKKTPAAKPAAPKAARRSKPAVTK